MATIHDNKFEFILSGLTEVKFTEKDHEITDKQPYEGVTTSISFKLYFSKYSMN